MGSSFSLVLFGLDRPRLESAAAAAFAEAPRLDRLLSNYLAKSEWSARNREAAFYNGDEGLPQPEEVKAALNRVGYRHVQLDPGPRTVGFARLGMDLDPGGIGKGYAVDRMVEVLKQAGVRIALVSASGSSIYGLGAPPHEPRGWPITIRSPRDPSAVATHLVLRNMSLSTSGSYEKFFWAEGRTYSHIVDPRTGYPAQGTSAVPVLAPQTIDSEAWTKPFFINGRAWASAHKPAGFRVFFCEERPQATCGWLP